MPRVRWALQQQAVKYTAIPLATLAIIIGAVLAHAGDQEPNRVIRPHTTVALILPDVMIHAPESSTLKSATLSKPVEINLLEAQDEDALTPKPPLDAWHEVPIQPGDTLSSLFSRFQIHDQLVSVLALPEANQYLKTIHPGETLSLRISNTNLEEILYETRDGTGLRVLKTGSGLTAEVSAANTKLNTQTKIVSATVTDSFYLAGQRAGLPDHVIMNLMAIFGWSIDFALEVREGDRFTVIYEELYKDGKKLRSGNIIAAEFINNGKIHRALQYTDRNGHTDYYSPDGRSMHMAFLRSPVKFSHISSKFARRWHPILHRWREHKGVDYAAPAGTPVKASGNGKISFIGSKNGYGKVIFVQHGDKYTTVYGHLSKFTKGLKEGQQVKQGQVIGYVGQTGLASGPHLHYELRVNNVHRDPLTAQLPEAQPLAQADMAQFTAFIAKPLAQLEQSQTHLLAEDITTH